MAAALRLARGGVAVELFEAEAQLGGDCCGVEVEDEAGVRRRVDIGVTDFNRTSFSRCAGLFAELGLEVAPICQDASFSTRDGQPVYHTRDGHLLLPERFAGEEALRRDVARFRAEAREVLERPELATITCDDYFALREYSELFQRLWFRPRANARFSTPRGELGGQPMATFVRFWHMHGVVGELGDRRSAVVGGMVVYCEALARRLQQLGVDIHLGRRVLDIAREPDAVRLRAAPAGADAPDLVRRVDGVVIATDACHVVPLLVDADAREREVFGAFPTQTARIVVHTDPAAMPADRRTWGAYNFLVERPGERLDPPTLTVWPRRLAGPRSAPARDVFVAVNPVREPAPAHVLLSRSFIHPVADGMTSIRAARVQSLQGARRVWVCGSYLEEPFLHENALASGERTADLVLAALGSPEIQPI